MKKKIERGCGSETEREKEREGKIVESSPRKSNAGERGKRRSATLEGTREREG